MIEDTKTVVLLLFAWLAAQEVVCNAKETSDESQICPVLNITLMGGSSRYDGVVMVLNTAGKWQAFCYALNEETFETGTENELLQIADVVCRQLDSRNREASLIFYPPIATGFETNYPDVHYILQLNCNGDEERLSDCHPYERQFKPTQGIGFGSGICMFGVTCRSDPNSFSGFVRTPPSIEAFLTNSTADFGAGGVIYARAYGRTGYVCASTSDNSNLAWIARTACRQSGYSTGIGLASGIWRPPSYVTSSGDAGVINHGCIMPATTCTGDERSVTECQHRRIWGNLDKHPLLYKWHYGEESGQPMRAVCSNDTTRLAFDARLARQRLGYNGTLRQVLIKYDQRWLPIVDSSDQDTCSTICRHVHGGRSTWSICLSNEVTAQDYSVAYHDDSELSRGNQSHFAMLFCKPGGSSVADCAHALKPWSDLAQTTRPLRLLSADCGDDRDSYESLNFRLRWGSDWSEASGCLHILIGEELLPARSSRSDTAASVATAVCRHFQTNKRLVSATYVRAEVQCPSARAQVSCQSDTDSRYKCIQAALLDLPARPSLYVTCTFETEFNVTVANGFGEGDGAVMATDGRGPAYVDIDGWNDAAASVVCREKGFRSGGSRALKKYFPGPEEMRVLRIVGCTGNESSLRMCAHEWRTITVDDGYVGGVSCGAQAKVQSFNWTSGFGYPVFNISGRSTYICHWPDYVNHMRRQAFRRGMFNTASVLCEAIGIADVRKPSREPGKLAGSAVPNGSSALVNLLCASASSPLEECSYQGAVSPAECPGGFYSGADSEPGPISALRCGSRQLGTSYRLVGGKTPYEGHVEILHEGLWGAICDDYFNVGAATLICRSIFGPSSSGTPIRGSYFSTTNENYILDNVLCFSDHKAIEECHHSGFGNHDCGSCEQAGIRCQPVPYLHEPSVTLTFVDGTLMLSCHAESSPPASYEWYSNGSRTRVIGSVFEVGCAETGESVVYVCNAYNKAAEKSVALVGGSGLGCETVRQGSSCSAGFQTFATNMTAMAAALCVATVMFILMTLYAIYLRKTRPQAAAHGKEVPPVSYANPNFVGSPATS